MPADSIWNTAPVLPSQSIFEVSSSVNGIFSMSTVSWRLFSMFAIVSLMTVSVRKPRKSILRRPSSSTWSLSYSVTSVPSEMETGT